MLTVELNETKNSTLESTDIPKVDVPRRKVVQLNSHSGTYELELYTISPHKMPPCRIFGL